jgi:hypothetical protein
MIPLYTDSEFKLAKSKDKLLCRCKQCDKPFYHTKKEILRALNPTVNTTGDFCSISCYGEFQKVQIDATCLECGALFKRSQKRLNKSKKHFCSVSCFKKNNSENKNPFKRVQQTQDEIDFLIKNAHLTRKEIFSVYKMEDKTLNSKLKELGVWDIHYVNNYVNGRYYDEATEQGKKDKLSIVAKKNKLGGYKYGSGRGKSGTYKGYKCDSSYELAWVIYHLENNIAFERNSERFPYEYKSETHDYIPDFIVGGIYYELKGYMTDEVTAKIKQFPHPINLWFKKDMKHIFDYVESKYGKNFIKLYEDREYPTCKSCNGYICKVNKSGLCFKCVIRDKKIKSESTYTRKSNCSCGNVISKKGLLCVECSILKSRKVPRPSLEILMLDIEELGYCGTGRKYGVSDNAIRKWVRVYNKSLNP